MKKLKWDLKGRHFVNIFASLYILEQYFQKVLILLYFNTLFNDTTFFTSFINKHLLKTLDNLLPVKKEEEKKVYD